MTTPQPAPTQWRGPSPEGRSVQVVGTLFPVLSFIFVLLRTVSRWQAFHKLHADDWAIIIAQILVFGFVVETNIWVEKYALGWPQDTLPEQQAELSIRTFYIFELNWAVVAPIYKIAVLLLYRRIFSIFQAFNITLYVAGFLTVGLGIGTIFSAIFQCVPVEAFWIFAKRATAQCLDGSAFCIATGILSLLLDTFILAIPIALTWKLHLPRARKYALTGLFLLGAFVVVAGIVRVYFLSTTVGENFTGTLPESSIWSVIEPCTGIISACLPTLNGLWKSIYRRAKTGSSSSRKVEAYDSSGWSEGSSPLKKGLGSGASAGQGHRYNHSKQETDAMSAALQGWKAGQYTEITGSSALGSRDRFELATNGGNPGDASISSGSPDRDIERQSMPPMTPGPFEIDEVNITRRVVVQKSSVTNLPALAGAGGTPRQQISPGSSSPPARPSGEGLLPISTPSW